CLTGCTKDRRRTTNRVRTAPSSSGAGSRRRNEGASLRVPEFVVSRYGKAERAGFEPAVRFDPHTAFPVPHLRPLGHLSKVGSALPSDSIYHGPCWTNRYAPVTRPLLAAMHKWHAAPPRLFPVPGRSSGT